MDTKSVVERWDSESGFTRARASMFKNFSQFGLTTSEMMQWLILLSYRFTPKDGGKAKNPYISHETIGKAMGFTPGTRGTDRARWKQVSRNNAALEEKGWLRIIERPGTSCQYDLSPGFAKVFALESVSKSVLTIVQAPKVTPPQVKPTQLAGPIMTAAEEAEILARWRKQQDDRDAQERADRLRAAAEVVSPEAKALEVAKTIEANDDKRQRLLAEQERAWADGVGAVPVAALTPMELEPLQPFPDVYARAG